MAEKVERKERKPELRFKGFDEEWDERILNEIGVVIDPHPSHRAPKEEVGGIPFIGIGDVDEMGNINHVSARLVSSDVYDEHRKRYDLNIPSLGLGRVASLGKVIRLRADVGKYVISPTLSVLQFHDTVDIDYLYAFMNSTRFRKQFEGKSNGSTRQSVGTETVRVLDIDIPASKEEQIILGRYFLNFDSLITHHQHKYDHLQNLKKAMLEKMFPRNGADVPEIRFKGFEGAWEYREFGEVFYEYSEKDCDDLPPLMIIQGGGTILREKSDRNLMYNKENLSHYKLVNEGDFIVHLRSFEGGLELATNTGIISPAYHTFHGENIDSKFYYSYFRSKRFIDVDLNPHVYGIRDGRSIDIKGMKSIKIPFTNYEEQKAIGEFIDSIDNLISHQQKKLEHLKHLKAALLDKMFVSDGATA